ncbi:MAG: C25 family cysteine peptidase, partial [bacterium]|nr:C25 family cysteine peptidase [bacterium]
MLSHRDHGSRDGWGDPSYRNNDVGRLFNRSKLPVVLSINCETGWFDNETDDVISGTNPNSESFAERWIRNFNGGAVGVFASTRISYSGYNDILAKGIIDAIWPEFLPYRGQNYPTYILGQALNYGKMVMATEYSANKTRQIQFEQFHYFGDPATIIWTQYPAQIQILTQDSIFINQQRLNVRTDVAHAKVALLQSDELLSSTITNQNGWAELQFAPVINQDDILLVVRKENHRIQSKRIPVLPAKGLVIKEIGILDEDDNNQINIGEKINWKLKLSNTSNVDQFDIQLKLLCSDQMINLIQPSASIDKIEAGHQVVSL